DDLHMLIDIGAGTLDIVLFIVAGDEFPIMAKAVHLLGAEKLRQHRLRLVSKDGSTGAGGPLMHLRTTREFAEFHRIALSKLTEHDRTFQKLIGQAILKPIQYVKERRYPKSQRWHD